MNINKEMKTSKEKLHAMIDAHADHALGELMHQFADLKFKFKLKADMAKCVTTGWTKV